jgi:RNA polymerase sigma factor (sigma-70 family)
MNIEKKDISQDKKGILYDEKYFEELYESLHPELMTYGIKICRNEDFVLDSIHEVFLDLWEKRAGLSKIEHKKPYILHCLRNQLINRLRVQYKFKSANDSGISKHFVPFAISQEEVIIENEEELLSSEKVRMLLTHLTDHQREIVFLKYYSGLTETQIAEITGMKVQSVRNHLSKSLRRLREAISPTLIIVFLSC